MSNQQSDVILARCSLVLKPDGNIEMIVTNVDPKEFLKVSKENSPAWEDAELVAKGIGFVAERFMLIDKDLDSYIGSLL